MHFVNITIRTAINKKLSSDTKYWYYYKFLFELLVNQFYNYSNGTANHCHIIFRLRKTGLQAIGYHENDAKMLWHWIGTKKSLNDMEWLTS